MRIDVTECEMPRGSKGSVPFTVNSLARKSEKWPQVIADQKTISLLERKFTKGWILHKRSKVIGIFCFGEVKCFRSIPRRVCFSRRPGSSGLL